MGTAGGEQQRDHGDPVSEICGARMESQLLPGHTHVCGGTHDAGDHVCSIPGCGRYFWSKES